MKSLLSFIYSKSKDISAESQSKQVSPQPTNKNKESVRTNKFSNEFQNIKRTALSLSPESKIV